MPRMPKILMPALSLLGVVFAVYTVVQAQKTDPPAPPVIQIVLPSRECQGFMGGSRRARCKSARRQRSKPVRNALWIPRSRS